MTRPTVSALALLPLRLFSGATFLWAGLDKLLDPTFFDPAASTSLHAQLTAFARVSPLGDMIRATLPWSAPIGLLIAIAELGIGIGALTGIAFRVAAAGGVALSLLFWLTASWATHPYYFGADLPFAFGWLALALAGHGDLFVPARFRDPPASPAPPRPDGFTRAGVVPRAIAPTRASASFRAHVPPRTAVPTRATAAIGAASPRHAERPAGPASRERRLLVQTGILAGLAAIAASLTAPLRAIGVTSEPRPGASPTTSPAASSGAPSPEATSTTATGPTIARVADVTRAGSVAFTVPFDAPAPLPAGDPGLVVALRGGAFAAFDAVCTHAGCTVEYDRTAAIIFCPCHGAEFDPAHDAAVIDGPTRTPLAKLPVVIDTVTGTIHLAGS